MSPADDLDWVPYRTPGLTLDQTVTSMRAMMRRTELGLCGADDCETPPGEQGIYNSARDKLVIKFCDHHDGVIQNMHMGPVEFDGEAQRVAR